MCIRDSGDGGGSDVAIDFSQLTTPNGASGFAQRILGVQEVEVLLASEAVFADALASGTLQDSRTLLLTDPAELEATVLAELDRLGATSVRILGGEAAVSPAVADALMAEGYTVGRTAGATRLETAAAIGALAASSDGFLARAFPTSGDQPTQGFADALALGGWAAEAGGPVLLSETDQLSATTTTALGQAGLDSLRLVGGEAALAGPVADAAGVIVADTDRVAGPTRFHTAVEVAEARGATASSPADAVVVIDGGSAFGWTAGFSAARLSGEMDAPIVLLDGDTIPDITSEFLTDALTDDAEVICSASLTACDAVADLLGLAG